MSYGGEPDRCDRCDTRHGCDDKCEPHWACEQKEFRLKQLLREAREFLEGRAAGKERRALLMTGIEKNCRPHE